MTTAAGKPRDPFLAPLRALRDQRGFLLAAVAATLKSRVARSRLGLFWVVLSPLAQVLIFALILSAIMRGRIPGIDSAFAYPLYLLAGFLPWTLFSEIVARGTVVFVENANLLKKTPMTPAALPVTVAAVALVSHAAFALAVAIVYLALGHGFGAAVLWLPLLTMLTVVIATALATIAATLNVFMRDVAQAVPILLQLGFWFSPIVYTLEIVPALYRDLFLINPLVWLMSAYRDVLVFQTAPQAAALAGLGCLAGLLALIAIDLTRRSAADIAEAL